MPNFTSVSFTQGGLTALIRFLRGISSVAARTKPSSPALTIDMDALPGIGRIARMPVVRVIEPPSRAILRHPGNQDLSHRLAAEAKLVVGVRQLGERLECCVAGARDHRIDAAGLLEHGSDRGGVVQIDFEIAGARCRKDIVVLA